jgi:hypothetical protein
MTFQRIMSYVFTLWIWQSVCTHNKKGNKRKNRDKLDFIKILKVYVLGYKLAWPHLNQQL